MLLCKFCSKVHESTNSLLNHESRCKNNAERKVTSIGNRKGCTPWNKGLIGSFQHSEENKLKFSSIKRGKSLSEEHKVKISNGMKAAHADQRAWNIGMSRWNNEPSYPEKFFISVIKNHFDNKCYVMEHPVGKYSIDFAWVDLKLAIEIDGEQHDTPEAQEHDRIRDEFLASKGWKVKRIKWKDMFHNPQFWVEEANNFICKSDMLPDTVLGEAGLTVNQK